MESCWRLTSLTFTSFACGVYMKVFEYLLSSILWLPTTLFFEFAKLAARVDPVWDPCLRPPELGVEPIPIPKDFICFSYSCIII